MKFNDVMNGITDIFWKIVLYLLVCVWAFPTWFIVRLATPSFRADHPWKKRKPFALDEWAFGRTQATQAFDTVFWVQGICLYHVIPIVFQ